MTDEELIQRVLRIAEDSEEDVKCAAIIVKDGDVLSEEVNSQHKDEIAVNHAEIKALVSANYRKKSRILPGAIVYCSCEPCAMCLAALSYAKVARIVYAQTMKDLSPDDKQSDFDSQAFVRTLNFQPILEQYEKTPV